MDFGEICNVYTGKMIIKAAKRIFNSGKRCRSYSDLNFGVTFFGTQCISISTQISIAHDISATIFAIYLN